MQPTETTKGCISRADFPAPIEPSSRDFFTIYVHVWATFPYTTEHNRAVTNVGYMPLVLPLLSPSRVFNESNLLHTRVERVRPNY